MAETEVRTNERGDDERAEQSDEALEAHHAAGVRHPSPREYVRIAVILAVVTAAEVGIVYTDLAKGIVILTLFFFALVKFALVVMWFMHLKFDNRTYARFFMIGLAFALTLYMIVLISFRTFAK